jgi:hypothetical protein
MWLHYANKYQGAVLEFEAIDLVDSALLMAHPVAYQDHAPLLADAKSWVKCILGQDAVTHESLFKEYEYLKVSSWSYEREWRIVSGARPGETGLHADYPFHPREIVGIYFGPQCAGQDQRDLLGLIAHDLDHVRAYAAEVDLKTGRFAFKATQGMGWASRYKI